MALQLKIPYGEDRIRIVMSIYTPKGSFEEVHWSNQLGPSGLQAALNNALILQDARWQLLANKCTITKTEVYTAISRRWTAQSTKYANNFATLAGYDLATKNDTIRLLMRSGSLYRKSVFLGAIPDAVINNDERNAAALLNWQNNLFAYRDVLVNGNFGWTPVCETGGTCPRVHVLNIQNTDPLFNTINVTTLEPHGIPGAGPEVVRISRVPGCDKLHPYNKLWHVNVVDATNFTIQGAPTLIAKFQLNGGGFAQNTFKVFTLYTAGIPKRPDTKRRGSKVSNKKGRTKVKRTLGY